MATSTLATAARMPTSSFDEFAATQPEGETWELIDGVFVMQATPTVPHAVIASNIERLLNEALAVSRPELLACREVTIDMREAGIEGGNFVPDVSVLDEADLEEDVTKVTTCFVAVEVLSRSDRKALGNRGRSRIDIKVEGYKNLPSCETVLIVEQSAIDTTVMIRSDKGWSEVPYNSPDDVINLPSFGLECTLAEIYARTPALRNALVTGHKP